MKSVATFLKEVRAELGKVAWPSRGQLIRYTGVVIGLSLFLAVYLGGLDLIFTWIVGRFVN